MVHHRRLWALIATGAFIAAALTMALSQALAAPQQRYEQARRAWGLRGPARYQLDLTLSGDELSGRFRAEVAGGLVRSLIDLDSGQPLAEPAARALERVLPVEQLFALIEEAHRPAPQWDAELLRRRPELRRLLNTIGIWPSTCWLPTAAHIAYDESLGYPRRLAWSNNRCDSGMFSLDRFDLAITALRPLP